LHAEDGAGADANRRLIREARWAARLDHPNICTIYEVGESDGRAFIVMQLVALGAGIADAPGDAHAQGIVRRDIKPATIMITRKDQAKVMDFGIAAYTHDPLNAAETRTATALVDSAVVGSPPYMSPEQRGGGTVDGRSDVFSLGGLLYEAGPSSCSRSSAPSIPGRWCRSRKSRRSTACRPIHASATCCAASGWQ
jgi:eukaryotic-like serine/threonine-protein kinase